MAIPNPRVYGSSPHRIVVIHGGPGAGGELAPVARELAAHAGVLEPIQTATSLDGQVQELKELVERNADLPATLIGFSWGAWLGLITAARHPTIAAKLILVGSGPFEEKYVTQLEQNRLGRLTNDERAEFKSIVDALAASQAENRDDLLARLGELAAKTDTYDAINEEDENEEEPETPSGEIFQNVWNDAAQLRRSGELLALARSVECPVVALHGDYDPHPAEGVRVPLSSALKEFRFILLERCGHTPWIERQARDRFYATLAEQIR